MVTHTAVDCIGKVNDGGTPWHRQNLSLRGEYIDIFGKQVQLDVIPKFGGIVCLVLDIDERLQPLRPKAAIRRCMAAIRLVQPVCGDPSFCHCVHFFCTCLKLNGHVGRTNQGGVQRLVAIELGDRNMIFELTW